MNRTEDAARSEEIVAAARRWIGTPYRHQASRVRVGADCLGLIRGLYKEVTGCPADAPRPYAADWAEHAGEERLLEAAETIADRRSPLPMRLPATSSSSAGARGPRRNMPASSPRPAASSTPTSRPASSNRR